MYELDRGNRLCVCLLYPHISRLTDHFSCPHLLPLPLVLYTIYRRFRPSIVINLHFSLLAVPFFPATLLPPPSPLETFSTTLSRRRQRVSRHLRPLGIYYRQRGASRGPRYPALGQQERRLRRSRLRCRVQGSLSRRAHQVYERQIVRSFSLGRWGNVSLSVPHNLSVFFIDPLLFCLFHRISNYYLARNDALFGN
jgi:hypothetical protein